MLVLITLPLNKTDLTAKTSSQYQLTNGFHRPELRVTANNPL